MPNPDTPYPLNEIPDNATVPEIVARLLAIPQKDRTPNFMQGLFTDIPRNELTWTNKSELLLTLGRAIHPELKIRSDVQARTLLGRNVINEAAIIAFFKKLEALNLNSQVAEGDSSVPTSSGRFRLRTLLARFGLGGGRKKS